MIQLGFIRCHLLLLLFLLFNGLPLVGLFFDFSQLSFVDARDAIFLQCLGMFFAMFGYVVFFLCVRVANKPVWLSEAQCDLSIWFFILSCLLVLAGAMSVLLQIQTAVGLEYYVGKFLAGEASSELREYYLTPSSQGGLPGYVKMFHIFPVAVFLAAFSLRVHGSFVARCRHRLSFLTALAFIVSVFCSVLVMNRIVFLAIAIAVSIAFLVRLNFTWLRLATISTLFAGLFLMLDFLSGSRLKGFGVADFVFLYSKLGIYNFQKVLETLGCNSFGFSLVLSPANFVLSTLVGTDFECKNYEWIWNPAQNLFSYLYVDFGLFFLCFLAGFGFFLAYIQKRFSMQKLIFIPAYYMIAWGLSTSFTVPVFRSFEFLFSLVSMLTLFCIFIRYPLSKGRL